MPAMSAACSILNIESFYKARRHPVLPPLMAESLSTIGLITLRKVKSIRSF